MKDTILDGKEIEKPTARIYYEKMCSVVPELQDIQFDVIRNKAKNMKNSYIKAVKWKDQTGQGVEDSGTFRDHILRICPQFDLLDEIYSERPSINVPYIIDTGVDALIGSPERVEQEDLDELDDMIEVEYLTPEEESLCELNATTSTRIEPEVTIPGQNGGRRQNKILVPRKKPRYTLNSMVQISELQKSRYEHSTKKIEVEKEKLQLQDKWEEKKFQIEREKIESQEKLKQIELEHQERMRRMELEKEERIARYELDLKYKNR